MALMWRYVILNLVAHQRHYCERLVQCWSQALAGRPALGWVHATC